MSPCLHYVSGFTPFCPCFGTRAVFLEAAVSFISVISSSDSRGKRAWYTTTVPVFEQNEDFSPQKKLCSGICSCNKL